MHATEAIKADRCQALAFRIGAHNLARRMPPGSLLAAAGTCGIQNTPPGSAALALHARVEGLKPGDIEKAVTVDKSLLQAMSLRGAPYYFPTSDAAVFSTGLLPEDEESIRFFIRGSTEGLDRVRMSAKELIRLTAEALDNVLNSRAMTKDELGIAIASRITEELSPGQQVTWRSASWFAPGQSLGESLVRFALYVVSLHGTFCYAPRQSGKAYFALTNQWLGRSLLQTSPAQAQSELMRRYLHCYGPSIPRHFAEWAGISPAQADRSWALISRELAEVNFEGHRAWLLQLDVPQLLSPEPATGVRFMPPHEPLLQMRDRETLIPDRSWHRKLWRSVGNPGIVLAGGKAVASWRSRKKGKRIDISVEQFEPIPQETRLDIDTEAATLAPFSGCTSAKVEFK